MREVDSVVEGLESWIRKEQDKAMERDEVALGLLTFHQ